MIEELLGRVVDALGTPIDGLPLLLCVYIYIYIYIYVVYT